jgi:catechol 2,3-dioxygenase-like lactoylglutathione lyase family enzyme
VAAWQTAGVRQRVSVITLGVRDLARALRFYESLGWSTGAAAEDDVVFFQALALNVSSPEEVHEVIEEARAAGASVGREPAETFWGGYSAVFIDPEGHPWEVAHNPHWELTAEGGVRLR